MRLTPSTKSGEIGSNRLTQNTSADSASNSYADLREKFWQMKEMKFSDREMLAFLPFADTSETLDPPRLNDVRRSGGGVIILRVTPDINGMNRFIYILVRRFNGDQVEILPASHETLLDPLVQRAVSKSVADGVRRCKKFLRANELAFSRGLNPSHESFVFDSCRTNASSSSTDPASVKTATFVIQAVIESQRFAIVMNQDLVSVVELKN